MKKIICCAGFILLFYGLSLYADATHYHTVRKGDTLSSISRKYNVSIASIKTLNNIKTSVIYPRQKLVIRKISVAGSVKTNAVWGYETVRYKIQKGDNLWNISKKFNASIPEIKKLNNLRSDKLIIGQALKINIPRTLPAITTPEPIMAVSGDKVYYTVKREETLSGIADKFGTTPDELRKANLLDDKDFKEGQILVIPKITTVPESESADVEEKKELSLREQILKDSFSYLGVPYKLGGSGKKSIDCSTLTRLVYANAGISLPNTSYLQHKEGVYVGIPEAEAGDLVFFKRRGYVGHVGVYIGNNLFIHASQKNRKVTIASLDNPYFKKHFVSARRYIPVDKYLLARRLEDAVKK